MDIEVATEGVFAVRLTLGARETYLLRVALERACYLDTQPQDVTPALNLAENILAVLADLDPPTDP
jgi:hypothetical protein